MLDSELPLAARLESSTSAFHNVRNASAVSGSTTFELPLAPFPVGVRDLYLQDPVSLHSPTRGECSLFLGNESAFPRERLELSHAQSWAGQ